MHQPSLFLLASEIRVFGEAALGIAAAPLLALAPRGDGHPVLVIPPFLGDDLFTLGLRGWLSALGHATHGWELGRNLGGIRRLDAPVRDRVAALYAQVGGRKVSVVGWSLGGIYARRVAARAPDLVRYVVTLGSPFTGDPRATNTRAAYEAVSGERLAPPAPDEPGPAPLPMPNTAGFSRTDGVVNWRSCLVRPDAHSENVEILGASHLGMGVHPAVMWLLADRLAQPEGGFAPFRPSGPLAAAYGA